MTPRSGLGRRAVGRTQVLVAVVAVSVSALLGAAPAGSAAPGGGGGAELKSGAGLAPATPPTGAPDLGPNAYVFDPSMPVAQIQATVDAVAAQQLTNQFGEERYALLFKPGTYGTSQQPLNFQVGYYTEVAGLGRDPGDVVINGSVNVYNQCDAGSCIALNNFWRSLSNLTIRVTNPTAGCHTGEFWAVSQAAPMRRVHVDGFVTLMDYCSGPSFASGGFIADSKFTGGTIVNGSQQQFYVRSSDLDGWSNSVWNQVFSGDLGAPQECFGCAPNTYYTTFSTTPLTREKPYLYVTDSGQWRVFVPSPKRDARGTSWATGSTPGTSLPLSDFYIAHPGDSVSTINNQLSRGRHLLLTPGVYDVPHTIDVKRADSVVLGLGLATLTAQRGAVALSVADVPGVDLAGFTVDAGPVSSPVLVRIGKAHGRNHRDDGGNPTALQDVFFRIGGPHAGRAEVSLEVNSSNVLLDDLWVWRADHGAGVGWTENTATIGVVVNGDDVSATGLFVEHYQGYQVVWNGDRGSVIFFQSEMPYDVPSQAAWRSSPTTDGYAAFKVAPDVTTFDGAGMGTYTFFNQGIDIFAEHAYEVPTRPGVHLHDLLTIFLDPSNGKGGIRHVVNDTGGSSTIANPDVPVIVVDYP
ncbi:adenylyl cyclase [Nocardioides sp. MAH-18]|uniref:Adenylyl cyclase n=1 Tax=Nocardioides agri TaxID=2682843 RepID=A0A6L6XQQ9_9ACTN|nr:MULTISPECIES: adenylyl cyclase [unclassified Nocardioides]MBA2954613.1 adenylyl cyclase [Nocardioides sp. CGMCC 1.13656]MVQ49470.1 adenylyl cyclase [Nocardioides sp. MAH-18]